jgi:NlpC/P60 family putative phage cell wall peptidase
VLTRDAIAAAARGWVGTPYHHQASCKGVGCDCLGLIRELWRELCGPEPESLPAYTRDWGDATGSETLLAAALRHLGGLINALAAWAVGDQSLISLARAFGENWALIAGGFGLVTVAAKIERSKEEAVSDIADSALRR